MSTTTARAASQIINPEETLPLHVQWMPPGKQTVQPMGFDAPFEMNVTPAIARLADAQLQQLRSAAATGKDVEPYFDFNHKDEGRSFKPTRFFWGGDDPKNGGIRAEGTWTGAGAKAVLDGELCCVSATWTLNKLTKEFIGINHNVGGLVPRSAFHSIQAFAKASGGVADFIAEEMLPDADTKRLERKYGLSLTQKAGEKYHPFEILVNRLAEKTSIAANSLEPKIRIAEPELWSFHLKQFGQLDHSTNLPANAKAAEFIRQSKNLAAHDGIEFHEAAAKIARSSSGLYDAYCESMCGDSGPGLGMVMSALETATNQPVKNVFLAHAKSFAAINRVSETQGQLQFAKTEPGRWLLAQLNNGTVEKTPRPGSEHPFLAQAKAYGVEHRIADECVAQIAFGRTRAGQALYTDYHNSL